MKKIISAFAVIIICVLAALPCFADDYDNSGYECFRGSLYDGVSSPVLLPSQCSSSKYILSYSGWCSGSGAYCEVTYISLPSDCESLTLVDLGAPDNFRLQFSGGQAPCRVVRYDLVRSEIASDSESFSSLFLSPGRYGITYTNVPVVDSNGNTIFEPAVDNSGKFHLHGYLDDNLIMHYAVSYDGSAQTLLNPNNDIYNVSFYAIDGNNSDCGSPLSLPTPDFKSMFDADIDKAWFERGYDIGYDIGEYIVYSPFPYQSENTYKKGYYSKFDSDGSEYQMTTLPSPRLFLDTDTVSTTHNALCDFDCIGFYNNRDYGGVFNYDNVAVIAVIDYNGKTIILRNDLTISSILALQKHDNLIIKGTHDFSNPTDINANGITDLDSFAEYLKYLFDNLTNNIGIISDNLAIKIRNALYETNWHSVIGTGFSDILPDFFSTLRTVYHEVEFDTDYDLPALVNAVTPLFDDVSAVSLPDLGGLLAPMMNTLDIDPNGNFFTDLTAHFDSLFGDIDGQYDLALGDIETHLGNLVADVGEISADIDLNARALVIPDVNVCSNRLASTDNNLKNKFGIVDDVKDGFEDIKDIIEDSDNSPPDWSFTVFGKQMKLVDWSMYDDYRGKIQNVFVCIAYVLLAKYIYKTLPSAIGDESG